MSFKIGDSVRLKTDRSETMVITDYKWITPAPKWANGKIVEEPVPYIDESEFECSWHDSNKRPMSQYYPKDAIEIDHKA